MRERSSVVEHARSGRLNPVRRPVLLLVLVLACRHAVPAMHPASRGIPTDMTLFSSPHVACPTAFADARGVCTTDGGESGRCEYPQGTCTCTRPCSEDRHFDATLYLHPHDTYAWACSPANTPDGCPHEPPELGTACAGTMNCTYFVDWHRCPSVLSGDIELVSCWKGRWQNGWLNPLASPRSP